MLRECQRVLEPGGWIAGYVIHTPRGLKADDQRRASELGPSDVAAAATPAELASSAGFSVILHEDVTAEFRVTCAALLRARDELEPALREGEGDEAYEEERGKKRSMLQGIDAGLLLRSLVVAKAI